MDTTLTALAALTEPVEIGLIWRPQLADPGDEMVLDAALKERADALVTHLADFILAAPGFGLLLTASPFGSYRFLLDLHADRRTTTGVCLIPAVRAAG